MSVQYETAEYMTEYEAQPEAVFEQQSYAGKHDGWWAAFLVLSMMFGPQTEAFLESSYLPPIRFADFVIVFMLMTRWLMSQRYYGGFLFSRRIRLYSNLMLALTATLFASMLLNWGSGRNPFILKDFFYPIGFIKMLLIGAIAASFNFQAKQIRQLLIGLLAISAISILVAFGQRYQIWNVSGFTEKFYGVDWRRLTATASVKQRVVGPYGNSNVFGGGLVMLAAMMVAFSMNYKGIMKFFSIAAFIALGYIILLTTASRTAFFGYIFVSGIAFVLSLRRGSRLSAFLVLVVMTIVIMYISKHISELQIHSRIIDIFTGGSHLEESYQTRLGMWLDSIRLGMESPLLGVAPSKLSNQVTDNGYVFTFTRIGVVGLIIYLLMLASLFFKAMGAFVHENNLQKRAVILALLMVLINHSIFEVTGDFFWNVQYAQTLAVFLGLLCGIATQLKDEHRYSDYSDYALYDETAILSGRGLEETL